MFFFGCFGGAGLFAVLVIIALVEVRINSRSKYQSYEHHRRLRMQADEVKAQLQWESHTCGYHALAAIYQAFGIDERKADLRFRLGVDEPATPLSDDSSKGTLHPDILRVAAQDGLKITLVPLESPDTGDRIIAHLTRKLPVLVLISRRENSRLHWVVFTRNENGEVTVADSLRPDESYKEPLKSFLTEHVMSALLVEARPASDAPLRTSTMHEQGVNEMLKVLKRLREKGKPLQ